MKRLLTIFLLLVLIALGWQLYQLYLQNRTLQDTLLEIEDKATVLNQENSNLQADLKYFSESENLEKELRSRFNYKKPNEKLIIVVPPAAQ